MIRVGFVGVFTGREWLGGLNYFRNLLKAITVLNNRRIEPVLFSGHKTSGAFAEDFSIATVVRTRILDRGHPLWVLRKVLQRVFESDILLERVLKINRIQALSHSGHLGERAIIPTLAWIPDFQHRRLPEFFSSKERRARDKENRKVCRYATRIILSSDSARQDLLEFCDGVAHKSRVLRFVSNVPKASDMISREALAKKYDCASPYFFLPNQFWIHKNHEVVIRALSIARKQGKRIRVLATGNPKDYRQPGHYLRLMDLVKERDLDSCFRVLGVVPYRDLMGLMWNSIAVINPSRFEGWSTTVEEAKSMGKPVILSDIDVHREQAPAGGAYFHTDDAEKLAELMIEFCSAEHTVMAAGLVESARSSLPIRREAFARQFEEYILECVEG